MPLIDLSLLKRQLRLDDTDTAEDQLLTAYLSAAEQAAANYMGRKIYAAGESVPDSDTYGVTLDNGSIVVAILMHAAQLYEARETVTVGVTITETPMAYQHLLGPFRILYPEM